MSLKSFDEFRNMFDSDEMGTLTASRAGVLWLKIKAISRKPLLKEFCDFAEINLRETRVADQFRELFGILSSDIERSHGFLNAYIKSSAFVRDSNEEERIASELHKLRHFSWGGDYANALDKFLVNRYVKKYDGYREIMQKLETEIPVAVNGYVLCSWYNHWSTILIENIFRRHDKVLPAVGNIKRVDFFIEDVPFDLKTTYLPANFIDAQRRAAGLRNEFAEIISAARTYDIPFDRSARSGDAIYEITEKIKTSGAECGGVLNEITAFRKELTAYCIRNPGQLIQNLYEQQGAMRFDASNRLFVVLVDMSDFDNSWKLKRNPALLRAGINSYLDGFSASDAKKITFSHHAKNGVFSAVADVIFILAGH